MEEKLDQTFVHQKRKISIRRTTEPRNRIKNLLLRNGYPIKYLRVINAVFSHKEQCKICQNHNNISNCFDVIKFC